MAPLDQQSGQGGKTTEGELAVTDVELEGGTAAKAVAGYPADAINVAFDELGAEPDLVITGMASTDGTMSVVPAMLAERLGLPQVTFASESFIDEVAAAAVADPAAFRRRLFTASTEDDSGFKRARSIAVLDAALNVGRCAAREAAGTGVGDAAFQRLLRRAAGLHDLVGVLVAQLAQGEAAAGL